MIKLSLSVPWSSVSSASPAAGSGAIADRPEQLSNFDLVLCCQTQLRPDQSAFSELMRRYQPHVERLLYRLAPDWTDRADLSQEVWIRVYRNVCRLKEPIKFKGWLGRITTNLFYDELRKRKRVELPLSLDAPRLLSDGQVDWEIAAEDASPVEHMMAQEFYDRLRQAISELPEAFRTTIILRELQGLSYEEIAEITQVSLGTVKSRIARARHRLQAELSKYLDG
ncbi:sigma-70 family RNA polymerase sigma factor [Romeria aff. gracilis LEGE 07310]|uniref:Sigma-70 family RNA polymerase sigma factor n=1 Tax=Vasconcelosia minhoensis LEGE 07310 TaxID=915328 RepID=A0A8J7AMC9_9CYAN|nr:sigma-70 family RNA polymerase sigma factor [Romeria gracilis]MBE9077595.1 sigma-70 family RNA polymerase sigma factor [Romeria aff. gracilis LEGE 07310]